MVEQLAVNQWVPGSSPGSRAGKMKMGLLALFCFKKY